MANNLSMNFNQRFIYDYLINLGANETIAKYGNMLMMLIILFSVCMIVYYLSKTVIVKVFSKFSEKSKTNFDDILVNNKVPNNIAHIIPLCIAIKYISLVFIDFKSAETLSKKGLYIFGVVLTLWIVRSVFNTFKDFFKTLPSLKDKPIDSYIQVFMIFAWITGFAFAFTIITDTPIWKFFAAFGTVSAVIILVFKDTILGFVASIQVTINDMVRLGDWITFNKYEADGEVIEINLSTVKVQNFDKTVTTIPTYALISDSFRNWRGMSNSNGRRIKRALIIKQNSIKFLSDNEVNKLKKIEILTAYLESRQNLINTLNSRDKSDKSLLINGRNLTNLGVFRKYVDNYINNHSAINKEMTIMARQLEPTTQGISIEVYAFSRDKRWENYEYIIADIFDHLLAAVSYFDLELFELPSHTTFNKSKQDYYLLSGKISSK